MKPKITATEIWQKQGRLHFKLGFGLYYPCLPYGYYGLCLPGDSDNTLPVCFENGQLKQVAVEEIPKNGGRLQLDKFDTLEVDGVRFGSNTPELYRGRTVQLPNGYDPIDIDMNNYLYLTNFRSSLQILTPDIMVVAKLRVKGHISAVRDGYVLTQTGDAAGWEEDENDLIRIYRIDFNEI